MKAQLRPLRPFSIYELGVKLFSSRLLKMPNDDTDLQVSCNLVVSCLVFALLATVDLFIHEKFHAFLCHIANCPAHSNKARRRSVEVLSM